PSLIVAEHPKLGRLTLERPVTLAAKRGELVHLDDVTEELPGILKARAYHLDAERTVRRAVLPPLALGRATLAPPIDLPAGAAHVAPQTRLTGFLQTLETDYGVTLSPLLKRVVALQESDPIL